MSVTVTEKQLIVKQLAYDSARLETVAAYFKDDGDECMGYLVDEIVERLHESSSFIEAHMEADA